MDDFTDFVFEMDWGTVEFFDFQVKVAGVPQDITGWTLWFTAKIRLSDPDPGVFQQSTANGGVVVTSALTGVGYVRIDEASTTGLPFERTTLFADQKARTPAGQHFVIDKGKIVVRPTATRAT